VIRALKAFVVAAALLPAGQASSTATGSISGVVLGADAEQTPLRRVTLTLVRSAFGDSRVTSSDDKGRYLFADLPAGLYTLNATKGAYVQANYGATGLGLPGSPIPIANGQSFSAEPIVLTRGAVISGRLTTPALQGLRSVVVEAIQIQTVNGTRRRRPASTGQVTATTDARGMYRIYGLAPGDYVVAARSLLERPAGDGVRQATIEELRWATALVSGSPGVGPQPPGPTSDPPLGRTTADAPTYFPGTVDVSAAAVVTVQKGEERAGVDFGLEHVPTARIVATVLGPGGRPMPSVSVFRLPKDVGATFDGRYTMGVHLTGPQGQVFLPALPPGSYTLQARTVPAPQMWGSVDVTLAGEDRTDIQIFLEPALTMSGRLVFEGTTPAPQSRTPFAPRIEAAAPYSPPGMTATVDPDSSFRITGVIPGTVRLVVPSPATSAWVPKSAMFHSRDLIDEPFEIRAGEDGSGLVVTFTDRPAVLSGKLLDATGRPAPQFYVLVYSTNRAHWTWNSRRTRPVRAGIDGSYRISGLPPGEYFLCALTELDATQQYEPTYLEQFVPASIKISIGEGEQKVQGLRIGGTLNPEP